MIPQELLDKLSDALIGDEPKIKLLEDSGDLLHLRASSSFMGTEYQVTKLFHYRELSSVALEPVLSCFITDFNYQVPKMFISSIFKEEQWTIQSTRSNLP